MTSALDTLRALYSGAQTAPPEPLPEPELPSPQLEPKPSPAPSNEAQKPVDARVGPIPPLNTITYLQVALWDNLGNEKPTKSGRKNGAGTRFKMDIEMWDVPAEKISKRKGRIQFVRNVQLRTVKEFRTMIKGAVKRKKLTADYGELLEQFVNESPHDCMLGHVIDNDGGNNYHLTQFIRATFDSDGVPTLEIFNNGDCIVVDSFTDRFASGFIKYTAFRDFCGYQEYKRNK